MWKWAKKNLVSTSYNLVMDSRDKVRESYLDEFAVMMMRSKAAAKEETI